MNTLAVQLIITYRPIIRCPTAKKIGSNGFLSPSHWKSAQTFASGCCSTLGDLFDTRSFQTDSSLLEVSFPIGISVFLESY